MRVTKEIVQEFKKLDTLVKSGKATEKDVVRCKELAKIIMSSKQKRGHGAPTEKSGRNDVAWYSKYPELIRDSANIIFNEIAGTEFKAGFAGANSSTLNWPTVGIRVDVLPTIGRSRDSNDPFNYQMRDIWLQLHRKYRGTGTYEYGDLGIILFCIMQAFANLARAERIYGVFNNFNVRNRSYPHALLQALRIDPTYADTLVAGNDLADFRAQLNRLIARAKQLCLPKGIAAFDQIITLFGNVFKDADDDKAQWIVYDTPYLIYYDPTFSTGSSANYKSRTVGSYSYGQALNDIMIDLNYQFDALLNDTDVARVCSDMLAAFGENGIQSLGYVPENYELSPVRDDTRMVQLHNTTLCGTLAGGRWSSAIASAFGTITKSIDSLRIYQEGGVVKQDLFTVGQSGAESVTMGSGASAYWGTPTVGELQGTTCPTTKLTSSSMHTNDPFLNTWKSDVSQDDVVEMTRQSVAFNYFSISGSGVPTQIFNLSGYSTYVVCGITIFHGLLGAGAYSVGTVAANILTYSDVATANSAVAIVAFMSVIDWHPYLALRDTSSGSTQPVCVNYDLDNYSLISKVALNRIHEACTMSLFKLELTSSYDK